MTSGPRPRALPSKGPLLLGAAFALVYVWTTLVGPLHAAATTTISAAAPNSTGTVTSNGTSSGNGSSGGNSSGATQVTFTLSGAVVPSPGLLLGTPTTLPVTVTNPTSNKNKEVLTVNTITVSVAAAGPGCDSSNVSVGSYDSTRPGAVSYVLTVGSSRVIPIPIVLLDKLGADQSACRGKTFPLAVSGTATVTK